MRRLLMLVLLAGCAHAVPTSSPTSSRAPVDAPRPTAIFNGPDVPTIYKEAPTAVSRTYEFAPAKVSAAVRLAYGSLEVPITIDDASGTRIGNADFYRARNFAGKPMTALVNCGSSMTGPNASSYRIYMSLVTTVEPNGRGGATLSVLFASTGRDLIGGASTDRVTCGTTGALEQLLMERVRSYLGT